MRPAAVSREARQLEAVLDAERAQEEGLLSLRRAILGELTPCQRECLIAYCLEGKRLSRIAQERGVCPSTVWRHVQAARKKLSAQVQYHYNYKLYF